MSENAQIVADYRIEYEDGEWSVYDATCDEPCDFNNYGLLGFGFSTKDEARFFIAEIEAGIAHHGYNPPSAAKH